MTDATRQMPPQDVEAEQAVLGSILQDPSVLPNVRDRLADEHFYRDAHQIVYRAICRLADAGSPIDLVSVRAALQDAGHLDEVGGSSYLAVLHDAPPHAANAAYYAGLVAQEASKREIGRLTHRTWIESHNGEPAAELWDRLAVEVERHRTAEGRRGAPRLASFEGWREQVESAGEQPWLVEGLIRPGWLLGLYGHGKEGKSRLAYQLVASLRTGVDFLGRRVDPAPTIILDYEGDERYLASALGAAADGKPEPLMPLQIANLGEHAPDPPYPLTARKLQGLLDASLSPGLVVVDCARAAFAWGQKQESDSAVVGKDLRDLLRVARKTGWTVLIVHHVDKGGLGPRGSTEWTAAVDAYWIWSRPDPVQPGQLKVRGRIPPIATLSIELSPEAAVCRGAVARVDRDRSEQQIFEVLRGPDQPMKLDDVAEQAGVSPPTAHRCLASLRDRGLASSSGRGKKGDPKMWYSLRSHEEA